MKRKNEKVALGELRREVAHLTEKVLLYYIYMFFSFHFFFLFIDMKRKKEKAALGGRLLI